MGFDLRDIRLAMDVYTRNNVYLGTVLRVVQGPCASPVVRVPPDARQSSQISGEARGPMPTGALGNHGPRSQGADQEYATAPDGSLPIGAGMLLVGRWWGLLGRRRIPLAAVQTVSLERVVLDWDG